MNLKFDNPHALWLLAFIPAFIVLKVLADARARRSTARLVGARHLDRLLVHEGKARGWVVLGLELFALAMFAAALAKPLYGTVKEETPGTGKSLIIAIDTSRSMKAEDVSPSRLGRAQMAAEDLVKRLRGYRVGLMPFAGAAFIYAPLTPDTDAVLDAIQGLDTEVIPRGGSNIARAIDLAIQTLKRAELSGQQAMVIFSDGEQLEEDALEAAKRAREARLAVICVGVGTVAGSYIPDENGGRFKDRGKTVITKLQRDVLVKIADITGGLYLSLDSKGVNDARIDTMLSQLQRSEMKSKVTETDVDRYRWPLTAGLISLVAAFLTGIVGRHRGTLPAASTAAAVVALLAIALAAPEHAQAQEDLLPPEENAEPEPEKKKAREPEPEPPPEEGDPWTFYDLGKWKDSVFNFGPVIEKTKDTAELDRLQLARGAAAFKAATDKPEKFDAGMMEQAIESFGFALASPDAAVRERAHYNLANSIYERTKAADKVRHEAWAKAKKRKDKHKHAITFKYLDKTIRLLENAIEHYQETLLLNPDHAAAAANHKKVAEVINDLREIRKGKAGEGEPGEREGLSDGQGQGKGQGKGQSKGKGKGQGQGQGEGEGSGEGEGEGEEGDLGEMKETDEGDGQEKGEGQGEGEGEQPGKGKGEDGKEPGKGKGKEEGKEEGEGGEDGDKKGEGKEGEDESNKEHEGKVGADGDAGGDEEPEDSAGGQNSNGNASEIEQDEARRKLRDNSQEMKNLSRKRLDKSVPERRPDKDW